MRIKKIYICFEGVLADFDGQIKELWGIAPPDKDCTIADYNRFWERIRNENHFYERLAPLPGSVKMVSSLYETYKDVCEIVSETHFSFDLNLGKNILFEDENEYIDKTEWIKKYIHANIKTDWSWGGTVKCEDAGCILIDCRTEEVNNWKMKGGTGILYTNPSDTFAQMKVIEEAFRRQNEKLFSDKLEQALQECKKEADEKDSFYNRGFLTGEEVRNAKLQIARKAWNEIKELCDDEGIRLDDVEKDNTYQTIFASVGIPIAKVPVRYYPSVEQLSGSCYHFYGIKNIESLFNDKNFEGKTYKFKIASQMGDEKIILDYFFEVKKENPEPEKLSRWQGWKCFDGYGKLEGYGWADASIRIRVHEDELQSVAIQKIYFRATEPIWKRISDHPEEGYRWIGFNNDLPDNLEIPEGEYYSDETTDPPRGRHYKEQGILAYDDTDEIVILGVKDSNAEVVEIPREINGKPVTILDERCFANCRETLRKVILPDTLKEIGDYAFEYCEKLEKPEIPSSVAKIGKGIFEHCSV